MTGVKRDIDEGSGPKQDDRTFTSQHFTKKACAVHLYCFRN